MANAALGFWLVTAVGGAYLWGTVVSRSRRGAPEGGRTDLSQLVLFAHPALALTGLGVWVAYLFRDASELAWVAFGLLVAVIALGASMGIRTLRDRPHDRAEQQLPQPVVVGHGLLGLTTATLVLLTALGVG